MGGDPETTPNGWGSQMPVRLEYFLTDCGVKQIHIASDCNYANAAHADKWIPVLPNTDADKGARPDCRRTDDRVRRQHEGHSA